MDDRRQAAERICATLARAGFRALLAGGCVRDVLLGRPPKDYDIVTDARPDQVAGLFERTVGVGAAFGVQLVVLPEGRFEVATFRRDGPYRDGRRPDSVTFCGEEEDARRRDFTINGMFLDPATGDLLDYVGGRADLGARIVRAIGDPAARFEEDHLRLLRAVRFAARLGYDIEPDTYEAMRIMAPRIRATSVERVRDELLLILTEDGTRRAFELLDETGLLREILPEVAAMKGVAQPPRFHPEGDVFTHTLMMFEHLERPSPALALGALLHDVGKPGTMTVTDRIRFNEHDKLGAELATDLCRRLRMPNDVTDRAAWLVANHMRVAMLPRMRESKRKRFVRTDGFSELLELCRADCLASHGDTTTLDWVRDYIAGTPPEVMRPAPLITGDDLIAMGYRPGRLFSEILSTVEDLQLEGRLKTTAGARRFVRRIWPPAPSDDASG